MCQALTAALVLILAWQGGGACAGEVSPEAVLGHIKALASDDFEGRGPATPGEDKTVDYLVGQLRGMGLAPGNPDGSYVQEVPLVGFKVKASSGSFDVGGTKVELKTSDDWVATSRRKADRVTVENSDVVFVGYGVVAPEYGWDDYKGLDVRGKTIVMLVNDPPVPDPADPSKLDPAFFKGRAMTYYGRWTYKYEIASEKGAAAAILIHETVPAGYPYSVVIGSWTGEGFDIPAADGNAGRVAVESWIALETAQKLLKASGQDLATLKEAARRPDFKPVPLGARANFEVTKVDREVKSRNVIGRLQGSDPKLADEHVVYTAHWDHLGRDTTLKGDQIFNGAADNASGVAGVLEIARTFSPEAARPRRSLLFLFVTAEEKGLLGSKFYAGHPLYPLETTAAVVNLDVINLWGKTEDVISIGAGLSSLDEVLADAAKAQGRAISPDEDPEKGYYYRSDHFEFAKQGVPALDPKSGTRYVGRPSDYGKMTRDRYTQVDYHKVTDEVKPDWDLAGAAQDMDLFAAVGRAVADAPELPTWKPGSEFKARREAMLKARVAPK
ncbi:M20/M25/M40 family metallo-hydrolase [Isosphaeraceae bacterium EP7]